MTKNRANEPSRSKIRGSDILLLAQSVIGLREDKLYEKMSQFGNIYHPEMRTYELELYDAKLIWIINAFNICDLSFIEYHNTWDVAIGRHICRQYCIEIKRNLWVTENLYIECKNNPFVNRFSLGWRHDDILCHFGEE